MKSIFWFLFESSPKQRAKRDIQILNAWLEGLKQSQKWRAKHEKIKRKILHNPM